MSLRNAFACLDDSDEEPTQQVKSKAKPKAKAPAAAPAPARYNNRRDNNRRDNRGGRDNNRGRGDYNRDSADRRDNRGGRGRGEYNRDAADSGARKYRRDDRRQDRRRDADRRDRRRDGGNNQDRRGRNQYEKSHQKRGPKKGGHGGWGTDKDAVDVSVEESATGAASPDTPTEEGAADETPSEPAAPAVQELTLEEHEAAEKERRAQFNARWASSAPAASKEDLAKDFSGMAVVSKKTRKAGADIRAASTSRKTASKSAQKAKELKKAIFAEPTHNHGGGDYGDRGRGRGGDRGRGRGGRGGGGRDRRGGRGGRGGGGDYGYRGSGGSSRKYDVDTQDVNEFPAL